MALGPPILLSSSPVTPPSGIARNRYRPLFDLYDVVLPFLMCLMGQDSNPLAFPGSASDQKWVENRQKLDRLLFSTLVSSRRDLEQYETVSTLPLHESFVYRVDSMTASLLTVAHKLLHLVDIRGIQDDDLQVLAVNLGEKMIELQDQGVALQDRCPPCEDGHTFDNNSNYLDELWPLGAELKKDAEVLQMVMHREKLFEQQTGITPNMSSNHHYAPHDRSSNRQPSRQYSNRPNGSSGEQFQHAISEPSTRGRPIRRVHGNTSDGFGWMQNAPASEVESWKEKDVEVSGNHAGGISVMVNYPLPGDMLLEMHRIHQKNLPGERSGGSVPR